VSRHLSVLVLLGSVFALTVGCTSANQLGGGRITICKKGFAPIVIDPTVKVKQAHISAGDKITIPAGDYGYVSSEVFYDEPENHIHIDMTETVDANGNFINGINCLSGSGINPKMAPLGDSLPFVSDLMVNEDGSFQVRHRTETFRIAEPVGPQDPWLTGPTISSFDTAYVNGSPIGTYSALSDFAPADQYFLDLNADNTTHNYALVSLLQKPITITATQQPGVANINIKVTLSLMSKTDRAKRDAKLKAPTPGASPSPGPSTTPKKK
jgi:hypothetical protein